MSDKTYINLDLSGLLLVAFIVLKLCHVIDWSWWWVFSPIWMPFAIVLGFFAVYLTVASIVFLISLIVIFISSKLK